MLLLLLGAVVVVVVVVEGVVDAAGIVACFTEA